MTPEQLADRQEIVDTCVGYALALDTQDWAALRELFTADAVADYGPDLGIVEGYEAVEATCRRALEPMTATQHLMGNHLVTFADGGALSICYFQATHRHDGVDGEPLLTIAGRYDDRMVRHVGGWRIAHKTLTTLWVSGNRALLA